MLYHDVQRAFEGCYVLSRGKHLYGQIGGVSSAERGMFGMEDEVDVYDKNILYHVHGELDGAYPADHFEFLYCPLKFGWYTKGNGEAAYISLNSRRQWRKGVTRNRLTGLSPRFELGTEGVAHRVSMSRDGDVHHHTGRALRNVLFGDTFTAEELVGKWFSDRRRNSGRPITLRMNNDVALSGYCGGDTSLVWVGCAAVATLEHGSMVVQLPRAHIDYRESLEEHFANVKEVR